ncbi:MAG: alpha/beta hydrolase-fold protein [Ignavibacterium sp.]|nr:alpha/beta hydrolase-fold protein [Ignavibacterium sp.]
MRVEYHKWYSPNLNKEMELKVYGHYGKPLLVFPCQDGRFFDAENFGMIGSISNFIEEGKVKVFTVDSVDWESWTNYHIHPHNRGQRYEDYHRYIVKEVGSFIRNHCFSEDIKIITTGASMGAYHAANFFFRHPYLFDGVIALSGIYKLNMFVGNYYDELVYFNSPLHYLRNLQDQNILDLYKQSKIIIACGQGAWEDEMLEDTFEMKQILEEKQIPAWIDIWGFDVNHDWPWWNKMLPYFLSKIL